MQINSINKSWLLQEIGVTDLADPLQNLHSGIYMLGDLYGKYGDWHKALVCYNCGETGAYNHSPVAVTAAMSWNWRKSGRR